MHEKHHTEGFVLRVTELGEANTLFRIFTKDLGLITATAQSLRREQSKLKGHLSLYAHVVIDAVRGRDLWRITAARTIGDLPFSLATPARRVYGRTLEALDRLYHGEEVNEALFGHLKKAAEFLQKETLSKQSLKFLDTVSIVRLLGHLGYLAEKEAGNGTFHVPLEHALRAMTEEKNKILIEESQKALHVSHL